MNLELLILGGYGPFVWPAYIFTFTICYAFYLKIRREFKKQEKIFSIEFKETEDTKVEETKEKEALSGSLTF
jgi:heme exporter protein D